MRTRTAAQQAVIRLRTKLKLTQRELADELGVATGTVCRWETSRPPTGQSLIRLFEFAIESDAAEIAQIFEQRIEAPERVRRAARALPQILERLGQIEQKLDGLRFYLAQYALERRVPAPPAAPPARRRRRT